MPTTDFALYVRQIALQQTQEAFAFWRNLLRDSTITKLPYAVPQNGTKEAALECTTNIPIPNPLSESQWPAWSKPHGPTSSAK